MCKVMTSRAIEGILFLPIVVNAGNESTAIPFTQNQMTTSTVLLGQNSTAMPTSGMGPVDAIMSFIFTDGNIALLVSCIVFALIVVVCASISVKYRSKICVSKSRLQRSNPTPLYHLDVTSSADLAESLPNAAADLNASGPHSGGASPAGNHLQDPDVLEFLEKLGLKEYHGILTREKITANDLPYLNEGDLRTIGIPLGPAKRIAEKIQGMHVYNEPEDKRYQYHYKSMMPEEKRNEANVAYQGLVPPPYDYINPPPYDTQLPPPRPARSNLIPYARQDDGQGGYHYDYTDAWDYRPNYLHLI